MVYSAKRTLIKMSTEQLDKNVKEINETVNHLIPQFPDIFQKILSNIWRATHPETEKGRGWDQKKKMREISENTPIFDSP